MRKLRLASILLALALATPALGQVRVVGRVIDNATEEPLAATQVVLRDRHGEFIDRAATDESGVFQFDVDHTSAVIIHAERMGYQENTTPTLYFDNHAFFKLELRLDPDAVLLAPLEVVGRSDVDSSPLLDGFRFRLRHGTGIYITRNQVEKAHPMYVSDLLRDVPGVNLVGQGSGSRPVVQVGRSAGRDCVTQIFVDGFLVNRRTLTMSGYRGDVFRLDDHVSPESIEGIEIYRGVSTVPAEFLNGDAACGVIAVWTRRGGS